MTTIKKIILMNLLFLAFGYSNDFFESFTNFGGYGELHFNFSKEKEKKSTRKLDFHRFVLFYSHSWTEELSFKAEVELEHNLVQSGQGELELEQAYLNYAFLNHSLNLKTGVLLAPISYMNIYHEPNLFLSVERTRYSNRLIPSTWFDNGISLSWNIIPELTVLGSILGGLDLHTIRDKQDRLRSGRQKGYKTNAHSLLYTGSFSWNPFINFTVGGSISHNQDNMDENDQDSNQINEELSVQILESYIKYQSHRFFILAEGSFISLDKSIGNGANGFYIDFGINLLSKTYTEKIFFWVRYETYHNDIGDQSREYNAVFGLTYQPVSFISYKTDIGIRKTKGGPKTTLFNLGTGYSF